MDAINKDKKIFTVRITDMTSDGAGIGRIDIGRIDTEKMNNLAVFTDGALPGDLCEIKIIKNKNYAYGELIKIIEPSPDRVKPVCRVSGKCGGCALQSLSYEAQLRLKRKITVDCLERIGGIKNARVCRTIGMGTEMGTETPYNYRNKAQFPVKKNKRNPDKIDIGFYSRRTHDVININDCVISHKTGAQVIQVFRDYFERNKSGDIVYDELTHTGIIRHIFIRAGFATGEVMVCIAANLPASLISSASPEPANSANPGKDLPDCARLIGGLKKIKGVTGVVLNINSERTNVILGRVNKVLYGRDYIFDYIMGKKFKISVSSFYQVNPVQTEKLYGKALEFAQVHKDYVCIDAYCGIGTIALIFAPFIKKIYGVETAGQAVADARENAALNNIANAEFIEGKAETVVAELVSRENVDLIIADPPRKGCDIKLIDAIISARIKRIVYISCNPATLARDIKILTEGGYKLAAVQPVDCFPHTMHVECVAGLYLQD